MVDDDFSPCAAYLVPVMICAIGFSFSVEDKLRSVL